MLSPYKNQHCLTIENVSKFYPKNKSKRLADSEIKKAIFKTLLGRKEKNIDLDEQFSALKNISFKVKQSESLGIIGLNGSGKSTLVQIIAGTMQPTIGKVDVNGKVAALLELGSGFNPDFTGKENVIIKSIDKTTLRINDILSGMFRAVGIKLVDFKIEYGKTWNKDNEKREIVLADEISPDTCRLWDSKTEKKLDKDRFRKDLGNIIQAYQDVARRFGIMPEETNISEVNFGKTIPLKFKKK